MDWPKTEVVKISNNWGENSSSAITHVHILSECEHEKLRFSDGLGGIRLDFKFDLLRFRSILGLDQSSIFLLIVWGCN